MRTSQYLSSDPFVKLRLSAMLKIQDINQLLALVELHISSDFPEDDEMLLSKQSERKITRGLLESGEKVKIKSVDQAGIIEVSFH